MILKLDYKNYVNMIIVYLLDRELGGGAIAVSGKNCQKCFVVCNSLPRLQHL